MNRTVGQLVISSSLLSLVLMGCAQEPTERDYDDVAASVGAVVAGEAGGEVATLTATVTAARGEATLAVNGDIEGSIQLRLGGLAFDADLTCRDEEGVVLLECGASTDQASLTHHSSGELQLPLLGLGGSFEHYGDWTLTNLQEEQTELTGEGGFSFETTFQGLLGQREGSLSLEASAEYDGVRYDWQRGLIVGGEIRYRVQGARSRRVHDFESAGEFTVEAVLTFDGSGRATLTLDGEHEYSVNLENGQVSEQ